MWWMRYKYVFSIRIYSGIKKSSSAVISEFGCSDIDVFSLFSNLYSKRIKSVLICQCNGYSELQSTCEKHSEIKEFKKVIPKRSNLFSSISRICF